MSQAATQLPDINELDARVEALMSDIAQTTSSVTQSAQAAMAPAAPAPARRSVVQIADADDSEPDAATDPTTDASTLSDDDAPSIPGFSDAEFMDFAAASTVLGIDAPVSAAPADLPVPQLAPEINAIATQPIFQETVEPVSVAVNEHAPSIDDVLADAAAELQDSLDHPAALMETESAIDESIQLDAVAQIPANDPAASALSTASSPKPISFDESDFASPDDVAALPEAAAAAVVDALEAAPASKLAVVPEAKVSRATSTPAPTLAPVPVEHVSDESKLADLEKRATLAPIADIEALDKALADNAEKSVAEAEANAPTESELAAQSAAAAKAEADKQQAAAAALATKQAAQRPEVKSPAPQPAPAAASAAPIIADVIVAPVERVPLSARVAMLTRPIGSLLSKALSPIATVHAKMPEGTRQTIGFLAIMQIFAAAVVWGWVFTPKLQKDVQVDTAGIYETDAEAKTHAEKQAHAAKAEAHAKPAEPDAHAKPEEHAKPDAHGKKDDKAKKSGDAGHGKPEEKKTAAKSSKKSDAKKPDAKKADAKASGH